MPGPSRSRPPSRASGITHDALPESCDESAPLPFCTQGRVPPSLPCRPAGSLWAAGLFNLTAWGVLETLFSLALSACLIIARMQKAGFVLSCNSISSGSILFFSPVFIFQLIAFLQHLCRWIFLSYKLKVQSCELKLQSLIETLTCPFPLEVPPVLSETHLMSFVSADLTPCIQKRQAPSRGVMSSFYWFCDVRICSNYTWAFFPLWNQKGHPLSILCLRLTQKIFEWSLALKGDVEGSRGLAVPASQSALGICHHHLIHAHWVSVFIGNFQSMQKALTAVFGFFSPW